jgi:antitoxin (DNA-binding transcriptional repressor) of toxin-antitoxin stability system
MYTFSANDKYLAECKGQTLMTAIPISKAQSDLSALVDRCRVGGESFTITKGIRKKPVAQLVPVGGPESHETITDAAGKAPTKPLRVGAGSDGRDSENVAARNKPHGKRRASAK